MIKKRYLVKKEYLKRTIVQSNYAGCERETL